MTDSAVFVVSAVLRAAMAKPESPASAGAAIAAAIAQPTAQTTMRLGPPA